MGEKKNPNEISCNHPEWVINEAGEVACKICGLPYEKAIIILRWNNN